MHLEIEKKHCSSKFSSPCFQEEQPSVLYMNIDQKLWNKLHGPMHYKTGVTCVYSGHGIYTLL